MRLTKKLGDLWDDQRGTIISSELILVSVVATVGIIVAVVGVRDSMISEATDVGVAMQDLTQSFVVDGISGTSSSVGGFDYVDNVDELLDTTGDPVGTVSGVDFADRFSISDFGVLTNLDADLITDTVTGTIGDDDVFTRFTLTTDTGRVRGSSTVGVSLSESPFDDGRFTLTFEDSLTDVELYIGSLSGAKTPNVIGDFTITLTDGTVFNNASFRVLPDDFNGLGTVGLFNSFVHNLERVQPISIGGKDYVVDPTDNGTASQAAGRLVFGGAPTVSGSPPNPTSVGVSAISFYRGGGDVDGFGFTVNVSGRVLKEN